MALPEQELAGFFRRIGGAAPVHACSAKPPAKGCSVEHVATCTTEPVEWQGHIVPATVSTAEAPKKKAAQRVAVLKALQQLKGNPAWAASQPADRTAVSLLETLENVLSDQVGPVLTLSAPRPVTGPLLHADAYSQAKPIGTGRGSLLALPA